MGSLIPAHDDHCALCGQVATALKEEYRELEAALEGVTDSPCEEQHACSNTGGMLAFWLDKQGEVNGRHSCAEGIDPYRRVEYDGLMWTASHIDYGTLAWVAACPWCGDSLPVGAQARDLVTEPGPVASAEEIAENEQQWAAWRRRAKG